MQAAGGRERRRVARAVVGDLGMFGRWGLPAPLRSYQLEVARAVSSSVSRREGLTFTVVFPRQAGKNELSAQLEAFLLYRFSRRGGCIVKAAPTFRPQIVNSMLRLQKMLRGRLTRGKWQARQGYIVEVGAASCTFFSAQADAQIVGATASLLLEGDEAQDIDPRKWDRDLVPMGASGNATRVLYGTPWTDDTLLAREMERNLELEGRDGVRRHFEVGWEAVAAVVPAYGRHVEGEVERLGEHHPIVRTQYLLRPLARADRLLSAEQLEKLRGDHPPLDGPAERPGTWGRGGFVAGIDVAGADEEDPEGLLTRVGNPKRDSTALTIAFAEDVRTEGPGSGVVEPRLHIVRQYAWRNAPHRELYPVVLSLVRERWACRRVVIDATGVGSGLAAYLGSALGPRIVMPLLYTAASKSKLAYDLLAAVNAGRVKMHRPRWDDNRPSSVVGGRSSAELVDEFYAQAAAATYELRANQVMRWGVPPAKGHDDLVNAAALLVQAGPLAARRLATGRHVAR